MNKTAVIPFQFEAFAIRTQMIEGELWWVLADVCKVLELSNPSKAAERLEDDEKNTLTFSEGIQGNPNMIVINESGLYSLILRSNKPQAKRFKKWVTSEILPQIRKTGSYGVQRADFSELERLANLTVAAIENKAAELRVEFKSDLQVLKESLPINGAQAKAIHKSVRVLAGRMGGQPVHYRRAWRALYDRFEVAAHRDIPQNRYDEALEFIGGLTQAYSEPKGQRSLWEKNNE